VHEAKFRSVRKLLATALFLTTAACRSENHETHPPASATPPVLATDASAAHDGSSALDASASAAATDAGATSTEAPEAPDGTPFDKEVKAAFRVAACGGDDSLVPAHVDRALVDQHCAMMKSAYDEYRREWLDVAMPFIAKLRPSSLPPTVVYPFGGGDLVSALATYPDATEFTTVSLEIAGDIRPIDKPDNKRLAADLTNLREHLGKLFLKAHSRTINLDLESHGAVPGEVGFTMAALVIHGFEPVTFRYFSFRPDGSLRYLTEAEIEKNAKVPGRAGPFSNAEIRFRRPGDTKVRVLRHVAYDLSDKHLKRSPALVKHLETKGKVAAMTKAASHLLWDDENFSVIRDYLMKNTDWMISDTTGVPPRIAKKYGFSQDVYGQYEWPEPFGKPNNADATAFHKLFANAQPISFRYGYPDNKSHGHIVVTHR